MPAPTLAPSPRRRALAWGRRLLLAWLGWLMVSTVLLNQPLVDNWINRKPERFQVHWDFALSLLPGHVVAWGVDLRGHSRRQAWAIHARRIATWWLPWDLLRKRITFTHVRGSGVAAVVRGGEVTLAPPPARARPWTLQLADVRVERLWSVALGRSFTATGDGSASGSLRKVMSGGEFELGAGRLQWRQLGMQWADGKPVLEGGSLDVGFSMAPFMPARTNARQKFAALALDGVFDARLSGMRLDEDGLRLDPASKERGQLKGRITLAGGRLDEGSRLVLRQPVWVDAAGLSDQRELSAELRLQGQRLHLTADLPRGSKKTTVIAVDLSLPLPEASLLDTAQAPPDGPALAGLLDGASGSVDLSFRFRSLALLKPWLARWRGFEADGTGWAHLALRLDQGHVQAGSQLRFEQARLKLGLLNHVIEAAVDGELLPVDADPGRHRLALQAVEVRGPDGATLLRDADAELDLVRDEGGARLAQAPGLAFRMRDAAIPDLQALNGYLPEGSVAVGEGSARVSVELALDPTDRHAQGRLSLESDSADLRLADMRLRGRLLLATTLRDADLQAKRLEMVDTTLALRGLRFDPAGGEPVRDWHLDARVAQATVDVASPLRIIGEGSVVMSDLRLLLAMYAHTSDYPMWLLRLADAGRVEGSSRFRLDDGAFGLDGLQLRNERYSLQARLRLADGTRRGALLAQWGPLSLGVELGAGKPRLHLRQARQWYENGKVTR